MNKAQQNKKISEALSPREEEKEEEQISRPDPYVERQFHQRYEELEPKKSSYKKYLLSIGAIILIPLYAILFGVYGIILGIEIGITDLVNSWK